MVAGMGLSLQYAPVVLTRAVLKNHATVQLQQRRDDRDLEGRKRRDSFLVDLEHTCHPVCSTAVYNCVWKPRHLEAKAVYNCIWKPRQAAKQAGAELQR